MIEYHRVGPGPIDENATQYMVRMRDGVRLATDVYLCGDEEASAILIRLPYDKCGEYTFIPQIAAYMTARGYHVVAQDVRGKFRSEGQRILFINEPYDGYDTIEWVVNQPWCDGKVAMWGDSYYGYTQLAAATTGHPALKAIAPRVTGTRLGELSTRKPGERTTDVERDIIRTYALTFFHTEDIFYWDIEWRRPYTDRVEEWFEEIGERSASYDLWMPHPVELNRFPAGELKDAPAIPILQTIGWYDNCAPLQWSDVFELDKVPAWAANQYLLIEPIDHEGNRFCGEPQSRDEIENHPFDPEWMSKYLDPALHFFDVFVRGEGRAEDVPRVRWSVIGRGEGYRESPHWPPPGTEPLELFLTAGGSLETERPSQATSLKWSYDPDSPVPSPSDAPFSFLAGYPDERSLADHPDVLAFDGEPVAKPLLLAGHVSLTARVVSTAPEADFFVRLVDVAPDGAAHLITYGQVTLYEATDEAEVTFDLIEVGYELASGHALRVTLTSGAQGEFLPSPGTGELRWLASETAVTQQRVVVGGSEGARLTLSTLSD